MQKYILLKELLGHLEKYELIHEGGDIKDFSYYLYYKMNLYRDGKNKKEMGKPFKLGDDFRPEQGIEIKISTLIDRMYKYAKTYTKKTFTQYPINNLDDFGFLATLMQEELISKSELINRHLTEMTSGMDVIKRLKNKELLEEIPDPHDGRSKLLKISEKGRKIMLELFREMNSLSHLINGNLSHEEKQQLLSLLLKLDGFHYQIHREDRKTAIDEILEKYLE